MASSFLGDHGSNSNSNSNQNYNGRYNGNNADGDGNIGGGQNSTASTLLNLANKFMN